MFDDVIVNRFRVFIVFTKYKFLMRALYAHIYLGQAQEDFFISLYQILNSVHP